MEAAMKGPMPTWKNGIMPPVAAATPVM